MLASQSSTRRFRNGFECFCRLSPNYTYLTCQNCVCQYSVIAETTVKHRAFAFIVFDSQHWDTWLRLCRRYFSAVNTTSQTMWGIPPNWRPPGEDVGTVAFRLFTRPLPLMQRSVVEALGEGTSICPFIRVPTLWLRGLIYTCATRYLVSPAILFVSLSMLNAAIYLRLKPHLVVEISSDIVTE